MKPIFIFLLFLLLTKISFGQQFSFQVFFEDAIGNKDTIVLGYDINATDSIDPIFGEINIISIPLDTGLDVRITDEWTRRQYPYFSNGTFHTKKQICYYNCPPLPSLAQVIDIYTKHWPVTASWDSLPFFNSCRNGSVFTHIMPGLWWDCFSGQSNFFRVAFKDKNHLTFNSNAGHTYIDVNGGYLNSQGDTISVFWQAFGDSTLLYTGINELKSTLPVKIYPNPVSNILNIKIPGNKEPLNFEILNLFGKVVFKGSFIEKTSIQTTNFAPGVYLLKLYNLYTTAGDKIFEVKKIIIE